MRKRVSRTLAALAATPAVLLVAYYAFVAVSLPFWDPEAGASDPEVVAAEAVVLLAGASLAYAAWGLVGFVGGRTPRWPPLTIAYAVGAALTPVAWLLLVRNF